MTMARSAHNTLIKLGDGSSPEVFTTVAEVLDISGPGLSAATADVTSHDSGGWREHIVTLKEGGEVTFSLNFIGIDDATQGEDTGLYEVFEDGRDANFQIWFPPANFGGASGDQLDFAAIVTGYEMNAPVDGVLTADITLTITGRVAWDEWSDA